MRSGIDSEILCFYNRKGIAVCLLVLLTWTMACSQKIQQSANSSRGLQNEMATAPVLKTGADQTELWLPMLLGRKVAVAANPTSVIARTHIVDSMLALGVNLGCVFAPEHGFRGEAEAGESVVGGIDKKSGVKVISLYGDHKKPTSSDLNGIDIIVFDIQDVGVRFYTYISTLQYLMEAAALYGIPLVVLDRPNPHGNYLDGPVLDKKFSSFVGMQPIPVVYGMTIGEYASMLNGEEWLEKSVKCELTVVRMQHWNHDADYTLPIPPSPNLPNAESVRLYPSLCFFEGTVVSVGRGTAMPFQCFGYPGFLAGDFKFTPMSIPGKAKEPPFMGRECIGNDLRGFFKSTRPDKLELEWLISAYLKYPVKSEFFNPFFEKLAGTDRLRNQIEQGWSAAKIRESWQAEIAEFKKTRSKYLLYP